MNWNQLDYILAVAEEKNISKAARRLFISQPSLSISISRLEEELGNRLFIRTGNTLELTYAGRLFCQWAKTVQYSKNQMKETFNEIKKGCREHISIGISPHRSAVLTPAVVNAIHKEFPESEIQIVEKPNNELTILLSEDKLDMIIDIPNSDSLTYESEIIVDEEICIGVPASIVDSTPEIDRNQKAVSLSLLKNVPFILLPEESYFGRMSRQCLKEAGVVPKVLCECTFSETAKKLVESGAGAAFLPDILVRCEMADRPLADENANAVYFSIKDSNIKRVIAVVYKKEKYHSEQFKKIVEIFKNCFMCAYNV